MIAPQATESAGASWVEATAGGRDELWSALQAVAGLGPRRLRRAY